jgi:integrase
MAPPRKWPPQVREHKGRSRVWWHGRWHDLGAAGSPEAAAEYRRRLAEWRADPLAGTRPAAGLRVGQLCAAYLASDAPAPGRRPQTVRALDLLNDQHAVTPVERFGPAALASWQSHLCGLRREDGRKVYSITYVRMLVAIVRRVWKWGVATERIPVERYQALMAVAGPRPGEARPGRVVRPADPAGVEAALGKLRPPARALIELLALTGARPSELARVRPKDVLRGGVVDLPGAGRVDLDAAGVWVVVPADHKTSYRGGSRWVVLGERARAVLTPWLDRDPDAYCFSPREAVPPGRKVRDYYTRRSLLQAIDRACRRAGVERFVSYSLRHLKLSEVDLALGLDAAQHAGGHSSPQTTRRYAKRSFEAAAEVARRLG